jgi:hypothetical protein
VLEEDATSGVVADVDTLADVAVEKCAAVAADMPQ